jgi:predicted enzyme related to lactoylglutathione lyase
MKVRGVLAQATVRDKSEAERWYSALLGRRPDAQPMAGLLEWHFSDGAGLQVWAEPDRAGRSSVVLHVDDLDAVAEHLAAVGLSEQTPTDASSSRILPIEDPDGNRIVFTGS